LKSTSQLEIKVVPIGNSWGVRLPRQILAKYLISDVVVLEERAEGILLRSNRDPRLSWEDTFSEMAREREEDWTDFETTTALETHSQPEVPRLAIYREGRKAAKAAKISWGQKSWSRTK
jgi:antitoxin MazE